MSAELRDLPLSMRGSTSATTICPVPAVMYVYGAASAPQLDLYRCQAWVLHAARKLEAIGSYRPGWDSYGGEALRPQAKEFTFEALRSLQRENLPIPSVVLGSAGTVQLEWRSKGKELDVDLGEGDGLEYVKVGPDGHVSEGRAQQNFGENLLELAKWLLRE